MYKTILLLPHLFATLLILSSLAIWPGISQVHAQHVEIPDPRLRAAIQDALLLRPDDRIPVESMRRITRLKIPKRNIQSLEGLQFAERLEVLDLAENHVSDFSPLVNLVNLVRLSATKMGITDLVSIGKLTQLRQLSLSSNPITDIRPLANLVNLERLTLERCKTLVDIRPLANLTKLKVLGLPHNKIRDVSPLANLHNLEVLNISQNHIVDHSPLDNLQLDSFIYDQECDMPHIPALPRIENRTFPSVFGAFIPTTLNQPHQSQVENIAQHDMMFSAPFFGLKFFDNGVYWEIRGDIDDAVSRRDELLSYNPNMLFFVSIWMYDAGCKEFPEDWPYWLRDSFGNIKIGGDKCLIDFENPGFQNLMVSRAVAVSKCGLYDGIYIDRWNEHDRLPAKETIIRQIRAETRPDFLVLVNANDRIIPNTAPFINGAFMESLFPLDYIGRDLEDQLTTVENLLPWMESHLKPPVFTAPSGGTYAVEPPGSDYNLRWMRLVTTLSLTHSDGYVLFNIGADDALHYWYDFWDADLGQPVGEKRQLYQETDGLYIREFTNGWAVYNHSGETQVITLPEEAQGVASNLVGTEHTLPNRDGEMYLRVKPKNPADVNRDGVVNILDLTIIAQAFGTDSLEGDVNGDGVVNVIDLVFVANQF